MARVLLAGESWISTATHFKGFDSFSSITFHTGADAFIAAAAGQGIDDRADVRPRRARRSSRAPMEALSAYDVVILSDIGANCFVLPPETWLSGPADRQPARGTGRLDPTAEAA